MTWEYLPSVGFKVDSKELKWGQKRESIRQTLTGDFRQDDGTIDIAQFFGGDTSYNINYKTDLYSNFKIMYDKNNCFSEIEFYQEIKIVVIGIPLTFGKDIHKLIEELQRHNVFATAVKKGEFFFENLKMVIANSDSMGGEGNGLAYFYAGSEVSHLVNEYNKIKSIN